MDNIEFVITLRCKHCGEIVSLEVNLGYGDATKVLQEFAHDHEHPKPNPWTV